MLLIKPSFEIKEQESGLNGVYKQIEWAGRHCYKSLDKITETSAKEFVDRMIKSGHGAMLEHGTVYLTIPIDEWEDYDSYIYSYPANAHSFVNSSEVDWNDWQGLVYITTNLRVLVENNWMSDLAYLCEPTEYHEKRHTVKFVCDRGVSHEFVRHRVFSFAQESTRYCNYSKDKFGNEITYILPCWIDDNQVNMSLDIKDICGTNYSETVFKQSLLQSEKMYFGLIEEGWKPQQARAVLPNALKTELVMTGFISDWKHFFELRDASSAHPQARELAQPLHEEFIKRNYIKQ